jgi:hypothetical protein
MFIQIQKPYITPLLQSSTGSRLELNRLLATAVVNYQFRNMLLNDPETVLKDGYQGTPFSLADEERNLLLSIHADSLQDLAQQLLVSFSEQSLPVQQISLVT